MPLNDLESQFAGLHVAQPVVEDQGFFPIVQIGMRL